ncbi:MAG: hypothetical protein HOP23_08230 [Methylococcaceae bacterium]|nr:hypothetical protein [Methylococcaceae bacterium]
MKIISPCLASVINLLLVSTLLISCNKNDNTTQPQIADKDSVGCLIANDFYAVHFSVYLKPSHSKQGNAVEDREALLTPYCQELPNTGKAFFAADLIDRDVRKTPIGIRLVELEKTGKDDKKAESFKELKTVLEMAPKLYPRGVVEAQADIAKEGYYALYLAIGGDEALSEDDRLRIQIHVGGNPYALITKNIIPLSIGLGVFVVVVTIVLAVLRKKRKTGKADDSGSSKDESLNDEQ